jgi:hypothetical protein
MGFLSRKGFEFEVEQTLDIRLARCPHYRPPTFPAYFRPAVKISEGYSMRSAAIAAALIRLVRRFNWASPAWYDGCCDEAVQ